MQMPSPSLDRPILVTGGRGQLGRELEKTIVEQRRNCVLLDLPEFDTLSSAHIRCALRSHNPSLVLHCAAMTDVDGCEVAPEQAMAVNGTASGVLAALCTERGIPIAYISTDFVFDGRKRAPYETDDAVAPINTYGRSKAEGEVRVRTSNSRHWVVRTSWLYGVFGRNFPRAILTALASGRTPRVVADQTGSPTYTRDLAMALLRLTGVSEDMLSAPPGTYQFSNSGECTWFEFAEDIAKLSGWLDQNPSLAPTPIESSELGRIAQRPTYSAMSTVSCEAVGVHPRSWRKALVAFLREMRRSSPELFPAS